MTKQLDLMGWAPPPPSPPAQRHSPTSCEAAVRIAPHVGPLHKKLLDLLARHPEGLTDEEMQIALDMNPSTQRPRRCELAKAEKIETFDCTRPTKSGRSATVWHAREINKTSQTGPPVHA